MSKVKHKECFGTMFPDTLHLHTNKESKGKVFSSRLESASGWVRSGERINADIDEWDDCQQCPEFTSCFQLCLAKVALESAVASE